MIHLLSYIRSFSISSLSIRSLCFMLSLSASIIMVSSGCDDESASNEESAGAESAGVNTAGTNTAGTNTAGTNTAGTNTAGTNTAGTNTAGTNTAGTNTAGTNTAGTQAGAEISGMPPAEWVDMECTDGQFTEVIPAADADINDLFESYSEDSAIDFIYQILARRYPIGRRLVEEGRMGRIGDCVDFFLRDRSSPQAIIRQLTTIVHECGHFADLEAGGFSESFYIITDDVDFSCSGGDTTDRNGNTFARSLINRDAYALEACRGGDNCDFYRQVYLDGDPEDDNFEGGDQGFNSILEETTQYINSLAVGYAFHELYNGSVSERDGILTFLWYITRYLKMAREEYPSSYEYILNNPCWRELTLTLWGRAWLYLELTEGLGQLGINDIAIEARLTDELVAEIDLLRDQQCR